MKKDNIDRREFVKGGASVVAGAVLAGTSLARVAPLERLRYAIIGTGHRATGMWGKDIAERYKDVVEFVGLCDINPLRVEAGKKLIGADCPTFTDFDKMIETAKPSTVMVTTVDSTHHKFIKRALEKGVNVITEKPMVIEAKDCQSVLDAEKKHGRNIIVTFNYRYAPKHEKIKQIISSGEIGKVISVDFSWYLDTRHGADYFRRWHRLKSGGGSLWVHKATHHFDLINWFLDADPVEVTAYGALNVYGKNGPFRHSNCRPCLHKTKCPFYWDITKEARLTKLYSECESADGYYRDGCVYRDDVDIYDSMSAIVRYTNGASLAYSLNAAMPLEGYRLAFNGTKGRLEVRDYERQPWEVARESTAFLSKNFGKHEELDMPQIKGGHSGGDDRLRDVIFRNASVPDYLKLPSARAGAMSCMVGVAARTSVEEQRPVKINELVKV
ncbi:MAG: Gfo/Idh/MocA family oxidoreductase [Acidobacteria bacterium]|nr:Gfo/Idh/MocA family oxidoreductase [Acidobacteriota bacterium]